MTVRRAAFVGIVAASVVAIFPAVASAHGIGGRQDLPVPLSFFIGGAALAIVISFVVLAYLWPSPRLQEGPLNTPIRAMWLGPVLTVLKWVALIAMLLVILDGLLDGRGSPTHISPVLVWVFFWLVFPYVVAVTGNLWKFASPWRTLGNWINGSVPERYDIAARIGMWPATVTFISFTWLELVSPTSGEPSTLAIATLVYTTFILIVTRFTGVETGLGTTEAFENYNMVISAIAPFDIERAAPSVGTATTIVKPAVSWRGWLRALPVLPDRPGMTWFVLATIGTVTYDGLSQTTWWAELFGAETVRQVWFGTIALPAMVLVVGAGYFIASWSASHLAPESGVSTRKVAARFIHTLVPIALAYAFSHYFTLVIFEGQRIIHAASDPFGFGWNLFGTANWRVVFFLAPLAVWWIQLIMIVAGHIAGTVLAHDRALTDFGKDAIRSQYAMLVLMVSFTSLGLFILAG